MQKIKPILFVILLALGRVAQADIFGYADASGAIYLTDAPSPGEQYELLVESPREPVREAVVIASPKTESKVGIDNAAVQNALYQDEVLAAAKNSGVETALLHAVITAESNYNPRAISPKGATGLMQLMPRTARQYGVSNLYDPSQNIQGGAKYLAYLLELFKNDFVLAVAAYNAGENAVIQHGNKVPPFRETRGYVSKVMELYKKYRRPYAGREIET